MNSILHKAPIRSQIIRSVYDGSDIEVRTDGLIVWINLREGCSARFCTSFQEFKNGQVLLGTIHNWNKPGSSYRDWMFFAAETKERFGIDISTDFIPGYCHDEEIPETKTMISQAL